MEATLEWASLALGLGIFLWAWALMKGSALGALMILIGILTWTSSGNRPMIPLVRPKAFGIRDRGPGVLCGLGGGVGPVAILAQVGLACAGCAGP